MLLSTKLRLLSIMQDDELHQDVWKSLCFKAFLQENYRKSL